MVSMSTQNLYKSKRKVNFSLDQIILLKLQTTKHIKCKCKKKDNKLEKWIEIIELIDLIDK